MNFTYGYISLSVVAKAKVKTTSSSVLSFMLNVFQALWKYNILVKEFNTFSIALMALMILLRIGLYSSLKDKYQVLLALAKNP